MLSLFDTASTSFTQRKISTLSFLDPQSISSNSYFPSHTPIKNANFHPNCLWESTLRVLTPPLLPELLLLPRMGPIKPRMDEESEPPELAVSSPSPLPSPPYSDKATAIMYKTTRKIFHKTYIDTWTARN